MAAVLACCMVLLACGSAPDAPYASGARIDAVAFQSDQPPSISLITVVSNTSGGGAHSALLINADQRVIFDPAGSFQNAAVPERNDVLYGVSPRVLQGYKSAHARQAYHVVTQTVTVPPEVARRALALAEVSGPVPRALCASATSGLLRQLPGFEQTPQTLFPAALMRAFEARPNSTTDRYYENDDGTILDGVARVQL